MGEKPSLQRCTCAYSVLQQSASVLPQKTPTLKCVMVSHLIQVRYYSNIIYLQALNIRAMNGVAPINKGYLFNPQVH